MSSVEGSSRVVAEVIAVGDEILAGATTNTNSGFIARTLQPLGITLRQVTEVGDVAADIQAAVGAAMQRARIIIVTGGLGPTPDDHTKEDIAELFDDELELDSAVLEAIRQRFAARGLTMSPINEKQAWIPRSASIIPNPIGSAPGVHWQRDGCEIFLLPGVPIEMQEMLRDTVVARIGAAFPDAPRIRTAVFRTSGIGESDLVDRMQSAMQASGPVQWAFYPSWHGVDVKLIHLSPEAADEQRYWDAACSAIRKTLHEYLFSEDPSEAMEEVVGRLLAQRNETVATAESCTGGLVGKRLTDVPGSSAWYHGGYVTYSNDLKQRWLQVPAGLLEQEGAVSAPVAIAMAKAARQQAGTTYAVSLTGVAGPAGGTEAKPVGLVFIALSTPKETRVRRLHFTKRRDFNRELAAQAALDMIRRHLLDLPCGDLTPNA